MTVTVVLRYPVKSMLGERVATAVVDGGGVHGDRHLAVLDIETGRVATAKHPRLWRNLLRCRAVGDTGRVVITMADGSEHSATDADDALTRMLGRPVTLSADRPAGAAVERPDPENVLRHGVEADIPFETLQIAQATPGATFVDLAPVHLITSATLDHLGVDAIRYRPNFLLHTPHGTPPYVENDWVNRDITIGDVRLRGILPTPRCAVPTLEHGDLPRSPQAVRTLLTENRREVLDAGPKPCAGLYAEVVRGGQVSAGASARVG